METFVIDDEFRDLLPELSEEGLEDEVKSLKKKLIDQIEVKDHFFNEKGEKVHYSYTEMQLLLRAKYSALCSQDEADFEKLDMEYLENIIGYLSFLEKQIPKWRIEKKLISQCKNDMS